MKKIYKNSLLIEGDFNFNYLINLLFLSRTCIIDIFEKKGLDPKKDKKMFKNVQNLCDFLNSSIEVFTRLSAQEKEDKCIIHNINYDNNIINEDKEVIDIVNEKE